MKIYCGSADDVHPYQRIQRSSVNRPANETAGSVSPGRVELPSVTKLGGRKKGGSFRERVSDTVKSNSKSTSSSSSSSSSSVAIAPAAFQAPLTAPYSAGPKLPRELPARKVGIVDFLMGYHALLQLTPNTSTANPSTHRRELHPTIGFANMQYASARGDNNVQ